MRSRKVIRAIATLSVCALAAESVWTTVSGPTRSRGSTASHLSPTAGASGKRLGTTDLRTRVGFSLVLRLPGKKRLDRFLVDLSNPRSPLYGRYIDAETFGRRFGLSTAVLDHASQRLAQAGVTITRRYPERTQLDARAPARVVDRLFGVRLSDFRDSHGWRYHRPEGPVRLPAALKAVVSGVSGLSSQRLKVYGLAPAGGLKPVDTEKIYGLTRLHRLGIQGQNQTIAVISADGAEVPSDLHTYDQTYGLPAHQTHQINVGGSSSAGGSSENDLDLEVIHSVAPLAQIYDYNLSTSGNLLLAPAISQIVQTHSANIVSVSLGFCEALNGSASAMRADDNELAVARSAGINVFVASGDSGAYGCQRADTANTGLSVQYPSSSPNVVAVGGTSLSVAQDGSYLGEAPWNVVLEQAGAGGGLSRIFQRPAYQAGSGVQNQFSTGMRQVPDVSADSDTNTGWSVICTPCGGPPKQELGGTSGATPFWASAMLLIRQYASQHGVPRLGFVNPTLYAIAANQTPASPAFHDVSTGTNRYYPATPGWDFATGLGSPDVYNLAQDMVSYLHQHPLHALAGP